MLLIAAGFICGKIRLFDDHSTERMSTLVLKIVTPCTIIDSMNREFDVTALHAMLHVIVIAFGVHLLASVLAFAVLRKGKAQTLHVLRFGVIFGNCGYMGLPLLQALYGADGIFYGACFILVFNIVQWTFGLYVMSGDVREMRPAKLFNPALVAVAIGLILFLSPVRPPQVLSNAVSYLASMNVPLPMMITGYFLSKADLIAIWKHVEYYKAILLRLVVLPLISVLILSFTGFDITLLGSCVVCASVPAAAVTTMLATTYRQDTETAANVVSISTLLSMVTLPLIVSLAQIVIR